MFLHYLLIITEVTSCCEFLMDISQKKKKKKRILSSILFFFTWINFVWIIWHIGKFKLKIFMLETLQDVNWDTKLLARDILWLMQNKNYITTLLWVMSSYENILFQLTLTTSNCENFCVFNIFFFHRLLGK